MSEYRAQKLELLKDWASVQGIEMLCGLRAGSGADGAGLYSLSPVTAGTTLVKVPARKVLTRAAVIDYAKSQPILRDLLERNTQGEKLKEGETLDLISDKDVLTRFFCYKILSNRRGDAAKEDPWNVWVESLPPLKEMNLPVSWDRQDVEDLVGTSIYEATLSKVNFLKFRYARFFESKEVRKIVSEYVSTGATPDTSLDTNTEITFQDWLLIESWIASRSLEVVDLTTLEQDVKDLCLGLVPIVDMCNHMSPANAKYELDEATGDVTLVATANISTDTQIYINYGESKGSGEMLFSYGFIPQGDGAARVATFPIPDLLGDEKPEDEETMVLHAKDNMFGARPRLMTISQADPSMPAVWRSDYITFLALAPEEFSFASQEEASEEEQGQVILFRDTVVDLDNVCESLSGVIDDSVRQRADFMAQSLIVDVLGADLADEEGAGHGQQPHPLVELEKSLLAAVKFAS